MSEPLWSLKEYAESIGMTYRALWGRINHRKILIEPVNDIHVSKYNGRHKVRINRYKLSELKEKLRGIENPTP